MNLAEALRVPTATRLAFVGGGGKTTAVFQLARELPPPVLVTTTTHWAKDQIRLADRHILVGSLRDLSGFSGVTASGVTAITGPESENERVKGVEPTVLEQILLLADSHKLPLLVEADGSRRLPLKAPADHEPAIPTFRSSGGVKKWLDTVVVVAGLSGLGKPLSTEWVHRPERFSVISGLKNGAKITPEALARVLIHPAGGLKKIPPGVRQVVLLNQADTPELQAQAQGIVYGSSRVGTLLSTYHAAIVTSLQSDSIYAVHEPVAGIILAAGESRRFGEPKQLLMWHGEPFVRHLVHKALLAGISPVVVVTGAHSSDVQRVLENLDVIIRHNPDWKDGQSTSIKAGLGALPEHTGAVIFLLVDQPQVPVNLIRKLVEVHAGTLSPLTAPQAGGRRANPVLFDRVTFPELLKLDGDMGGRKLFSKYPVTWFPWHDNSLLLDVDTPKDYQRLLEYAV